MIRILADTCVWIDWLNAGRHREALFAPGRVKYLSAVAAMELAAGAPPGRDRKAVDRLNAAFSRLRRVVTPTAREYAEAGRVLRAVRVEFGKPRAGAPSLVFDVLIALSARDVGARVVTTNAADFRLIRSVVPFALEVLDG
jgi:predicted nucleic acid-binding protein